MCKTKTSTQVVESTSSRSPRVPPSNATSSSIPRSRNSNSNSNSSSSNSSFYHKDSNTTSSIRSSKTSLSTLKNSISESPHIYDFSEIRSATNNFLSKPFSSSTTSTSWRCLLHDNHVIIFQRKLRRRIKTLDLQTKLSLICRSHHSSLCKLKGVSISGNYVYFVYEYVDGINLSDGLRNPRNREFTILPSWLSRMQVAADLAHGLEYIHHSTGLESGFVHNHIKCTSIIVTEPNLNAIICHFGTAELCGEISEPVSDGNDRSLKRLGSKAMKFEGRRGYMAPEFQGTGNGTKETDVYAFGIVVLELLSGEEMLRYVLDEEMGGGYRRVSLIETAKKVIEESSSENKTGGLRSWVDRRLKDSYPVDVAEKMVKIGLECVGEDPGNRPDMSWVAARISKLYLASKSWAEKFSMPVGFTVSLAPR